MRLRIYTSTPLKLWPDLLDHYKAGNDCDEYAFFRSSEGGRGREVSFRSISAVHNRISGAQFGVLVKLSKFKKLRKKDSLVLAPVDAPITVALPFNR